MNQREKVENDPTLFPSPQTWCVWVASLDYRSGKHVTRADGGFAYEYVPLEEGKLKYYHSQGEVRKALMWTGSKSKYRADSQVGRFIVDWAAYEWVDGEWVKRFEGLAGEERGENPLFKLKPDKGPSPIQKSKEERAIESILRAAG